MEKRIDVTSPSLLLDEITEVLCGNMDSFEDVRCHLQYLEKLAEANV